MRTKIVPVALLMVLALILPNALGQQIHRNGFEGREPMWVKGMADVPVREEAHDLSEQNPHTGQQAEHWRFTAEVGGQFVYSYPIDRAPVTDDLIAGVWIKANRPGMQIMARMVLPRGRNPANLNEPLTTILRGDIYQLAGRWQRVELRKPTKLAKDQLPLLRAELKTDVDLTDAFIDRIDLNLNGGPGLHEILVDDLEVGPVYPKPEPAATSLPKGVPVSRSNDPLRGGVVRLNQDRLTVDNKRFLMRMIRPGALPLAAVRSAGFNTVLLDQHASAEQISEAVRLGLWIGADLPVTANSTQAMSPEALQPHMARLSQGEGVLVWIVGNGLTQEEALVMARTAQSIRSVDPHRPIGGDIWDGVGPYTRNLDLIGAHRWPLMTSLDLSNYRDWLSSRRLLGRPGSYHWTWIQTHLPDWFTNVLNDPNAPPGTPSDLGGPHPEQVRLLTYMALASGCQGLAFWSDQHLGNRLGRDRFFALALLNQELEMLEPLLLASIETPRWIDTSVPDVKAAVFRTEKGVLVLPMWLGRGAQYVPGQSAAVKLSMTVPQVPAACQSWEINPADVRSLQQERVPGGTKITLPEFGLTSAVIFTSDLNLIVGFQDHVRQTRKTAAQWAHDLAEAELEKVQQVETELARLGVGPPDAAKLQQDARQRLQDTATYFNAGDYRQAYAEAQRAGRPLRILMRSQWENAVRHTDHPVASPFGVSYYTLPRHHALMERVKQAETQNGGHFATVLPGGDFEQDQPTTWVPQQGTLDEVTLGVWRINEDAKEGKRCLKLEIKPKNKDFPPAALERTYLAVNSLAVQLQPGTLVRISGWVRAPKPISASVDGAMLYDSSGGEPLALRFTAATPWKQFKVYRWVPANGQLFVTCALSGLGTVFFDDIRIEPLPGGAPVPPGPAPDTATVRTPAPVGNPPPPLPPPSVPVSTPR